MEHILEDNRSTSKSSESIPDFHLDAGIEGISNQRTIVQFPSSMGRDSPNIGSYAFGSIELNHQRLIGSFTPTDMPELFSYSSNVGFSISESGLSLFRVGQGSSTETPSQPTFECPVIGIPRPPKSGRSQLLQFFLSFHREVVTYAHYFLFYDYLRPIFLLCDLFDPLLYSMAAFSALIYSMKFDIAAREQALLYYTMALQELRKVLDRFPNDLQEYYGIVATVLQLATFDVHPFTIISLTSALLRR